MDDESLIAAARAARAGAYVPYSRYAVGAALLTRSGRVFSGANVENASYGLTICAERVAIFAAVAAGERDFVALAVVTENGGMPCGACRQVLAEFALGARVIVADLEGRRREWTAAELLPHAFQPGDIPR